MKNKKWHVWLTCVLVAVFMMVGMAAIAAEFGSQSDPLVTLSYIEQVLLPQSKADVDTALEGALSAYDEPLNELNGQLEVYIDDRLRSFAAGEVDDDLVEAIAAAVVAQMGEVEMTEAQWTELKLSAGDNVVCGVGTQLILRSGKATANTILLDLSNGETQSSGKSLVVNHLYVSGKQDSGFTVNRDCKLLVCGSYTVE